MTEIVEHEERRLTEERGKTLLAQIQQKRVIDEQSYKELAHLLNRAKEQMKLLAPKFDKPVASAKQAHTDACKLRDEALSGFEEAEQLAKEKLANYLLTHESVPEIAGVAYVQVWKAEVTEEGLVPREYMKVDTTKLNAVAGRLKGQLRIPGVRVTKAIQVRVTTDEFQAG